MTYAPVLCLVQVVMVVQLDTLDTLPLKQTRQVYSFDKERFSLSFLQFHLIDFVILNSYRSVTGALINS